MTLTTEFMLIAAKTPINVMIQRMSEGMDDTIKIFALTLMFSLPLGLIVSFGKMSKLKIIKWPVNIYISIMRGTPLMLQLFAVYYGLWYMFDIIIDKFTAIILAFVINYAAYFAEIYRSGIEAMPKGQYEAAKLLGYNKFQTFIKIIFPQVMKNILPSITNEVICLVKDTSLAFALSYVEIFAITKQIANQTTDFTPFIVAAVFYYIFNAIVAWIMDLIEKKMNYYN